MSVKLKKDYSMAFVLASSGYPEVVLAEVRRQWQVTAIDNQREALDFLKSSPVMPAAISIGNTDEFEDDSNLSASQMLAGILQIDPSVPVIISTRNREAKTIVELVKAGAFDYVVEPSRNEGPDRISAYAQDLILSLTRAVQWRSVCQENRQLKQDLVSRNLPDSIQTRSPVMLSAIGLTQKVAPTNATVLISGESGTGKELIAKMIHDMSMARDQPFLAVNCGALSEHLLTSELFGHVKGAFTGAERDRPGLLRECGGGTLFLDEIATIPLSFQVMLLRVLEQRTARPVGGNADYPVHCRFIAAANRDLRQMVRQGTFREDLWYRIGTFPILLPPLRQRPTDIAVLAQQFVTRYAGRYNKEIVGIEAGAISLLEKHNWPGNVRELQHAIERAVIVCERMRIGRTDLADYPAEQAPALSQGSLDDSLRDLETRMVNAALRDSEGSLTHAAALLGLNRTTLHYRLKRLEIKRQFY